MSTIPPPNTLTDSDSVTILQIPALYQLPEFGPVRDLYKRSLGRAGCSKCRKRKLRPGYLAPSIGSALIRAIRAGKGASIHKALAAHYRLAGDIQLMVGPCNERLKS